MGRKAIVTALAILGGVFGQLSVRDAQAQGGGCLATTISGEVEGLDRGDSCAFLGIPFAQPPTGDRRWLPPEPFPGWAPQVLQANVAPPACAQLNTGNGQPSGSEDCLKLNVWSPKPLPPAGAPVIVWLHPGSFASASANFAPQNGERIAALTGAIVVAPNYRLGPFGYLRHRELAAGGITGNAGLLDQRAALQWVRDHVAAFGGDPNNVTLAGQSAGGHSTALHLVSSGSAGLFQRAIMQSGFGSVHWRTAAEAESQGTVFASEIGCPELHGPDLLACLQSKTRDQVLLAHPPALSEQVVETGRTQWTPIVDGLDVLDQPRALFELGAFNRVPVLLGVTRDEGWTFVNRSFPGELSAELYEATVQAEFGADAPVILAAYAAGDFPSPKDALVQLVGDVEYVCEARRIARLVERTNTPVFLYSFEHEIDAVVPDRVPHGFDVNLLFGNDFGPPLFAPYTLMATDLMLSQSMGWYWTRFALAGNPNSDDPAVVRWPAFKHPTGRGRGSDKYLILAETIREGLRLHEQQCDLLEPYLFRSVTGAVPAAAD